MYCMVWDPGFCQQWVGGFLLEPYGVKRKHRVTSWVAGARILQPHCLGSNSTEAAGPSCHERYEIILVHDGAHLSLTVGCQTSPEMHGPEGTGNHSPVQGSSQFLTSWTLPKTPHLGLGRMRWEQHCTLFLLPIFC